MTNPLVRFQQRHKAAVEAGTAVVATEKVALLGLALIACGTLGFLGLPGMIDAEASGTQWVNAFYCSVMTLTTIGFGDICPSDPDVLGRVFLTVFPLIGLGFFCGPILDLSSSWRQAFPGGTMAVATIILSLGVSLLTVLEGLPLTEALHFCVVLGTTIGYGDIAPSSDMGRFMVAIYAILVVNAMGTILDAVGDLLQTLCYKEVPQERTTTTKAQQRKEETKQD